ncbi:hypothetical protein EMCRGX_G007900 [Ephydatia muelleri]
MGTIYIGNGVSILDNGVIRGDILQVACTYNTTGVNNVTVGGESTNDEMCLSFPVYYPRIELGACVSNYDNANYIPFASSNLAYLQQVNPAIAVKCAYSAPDTCQALAATTMATTVEFNTSLALEATLPTSLVKVLLSVEDLLASGKVPAEIATHLAGGSLIAINKSKAPDCDIRPIAIDKLYSINATPISPSSFPGCLEATAIPPIFGIHLAVCHPPQVCSKAINIYNALVSPNEALSSTFDSIHTNRHVLSQNVEDKQFQSLLQSSTLADRARLLSVSSPHASSWLRVTPSPTLGLHLTPSECQFAIKWWLGIQLSITELCRLVDIFDGVKLCIGNPDNIIVQLYHNNTYTLHSYSGHQAGYIDTALLNHSETVRHKNCKLIIHPNSSAVRCSACSTYRSTLLTQKWKRASTSVENERINYRFIQLPDLVARLGNIRASYRSLLKQLDRLRSRIHQDTEVKGVFLDEECNAYIKDIICLPESAKHLESLPEDSFEHIFWQQQIETASQNSSWHMRWHPLMIRFCLSLRHKSGGAYELLRQSGCIKLPSQRTLQDYTHYVQSCLESALTDGNTASSQAKTMFVLMIRGLFTKLQFPYAQFLCCALKGDQLYDYFWEAVGRVVNCGLKVLAVTMDAVGMRILPKLKFEHIYHTAFSKMKVDLAAQVLSESVSKALVLVCGDECNETSQFVEMMDKFLDALNVHNYSHGSRALKPFQLPYTSREDPRLRWLVECFLKYLEDRERSVMGQSGFSLAEKSNMLLSEETLYGLKITSRTFVELV